MLATQLLPRIRSVVLLHRPVPGTRYSAVCTLAERLLAGPLTVLLALFALAVLAAWLPGYLTWPMWADHDVFATLARGWSDGRLPYRDLPSTNFPGPIYQAWLFGHLFGWGEHRIYYAFDAALVLTVAGAAVAWFRVRLGRYLPGVFAAAALIAYSATHDFALAAQRDWQAAAFVLLAALAVAGRERPRWSLVVAAALSAMALACRPQAVLLVPAVAAAVGSAGGWRRTLSWAGGVGVGVGLLFLPLLLAGVFGDFLSELGRIGQGGIYRHHVANRWELYGEQALTGGFLVVLAVASLGLLRGRPVLPAVGWVPVALAGAWFYRPLSPFPHAYIGQPFEVLLLVAAAVVVAGVLRSTAAAPLRLAAVLAVIGSAIHWLPAYCDYAHFGRTWRALAGRPSDTYVPKGYTRRLLPNQFLYPWNWYRRTVNYLKAETPADTPVANLLLAPAAINGAAGRPTPLHAESMMWVIIVGRDDLDAFAREILACRETLVVWRPAEWEEVKSWAHVPRMLRDRFEPVAAFDEIEVWRRKPGDPD